MKIKNQWWEREFVKQSDHVDFLSRDGKTAVDVDSTTAGSRGLYSNLMRLAIYLEQRPEVLRGCLVLAGTSLTLERLTEEWNQIRKTLSPSVVERLAVIFVNKSGNWVNPESEYLERIADVFQQKPNHATERNEMTVQVRDRPGQKFYEILKVLLNRWLQGKGPIPLGKLAEQIGCSRPTIKSALERNSLRSSISYESNRSVGLCKFPVSAWSELLALNHEMRHTFKFRDRTGSNPAPNSLLKRLQKLETEHIGLGGVFAARHWHPDFDLHGSPRLDIICHAPGGFADLSFVKKVDPALEMDVTNEFSPSLVVHAITRATSQFAQDGERQLPWADPVETVLDLHELSLSVQANQLMNHLQPTARPA